jgi:hypothetical protein
MFANLPEDVLANLAARGIDPDASCAAWLGAIRDGSYDVTRLRAAIYPPWRARPVVPIVIPLAVVLPDQEQVAEREPARVDSAAGHERE